MPVPRVRQVLLYRPACLSDRFRQHGWSCVNDWFALTSRAALATGFAWTADLA